MREVEASHTCVVATVGLRVLLWTKNSGEHGAGSSGVLKGELGAGSSGVLKGELGACSSSVLKGDMMRSISTVHYSLVVLAWFMIRAKNNSTYSSELQSGSGRFLCLRRTREQEFEKDTGAGFPSEIQIKQGSKSPSEIQKRTAHSFACSQP